MDAFSILYNEMLGTIPGLPANYRTPAAPVSYPFLWLAPQLDWVQWNGSVQNPIARNLGEVVAVFGRTKLVANGGKLDFDASMKTANLYKLEQLVSRLRPPAWPEEVLGKIDAEKAKRGAAIYAREKCASCHFEKAPYPLTEPNAAGKRYVRTTQTPLKDVGTDPRMASDFVNRAAKTGKFAPLVGGRAEAPAPEVFFYALGALTGSDLDKFKLTPAELGAYNGYRSPVLPGKDYLLGYKTGPLAGTWATAPYLHNGSVPTLYQLLLPPARRPKTFRVGSREFDPKEVGHRYDAAAGGFEFDTSLPGNGNSGHDYGTGVTDADRWDLVEYLKTL
jgi:mono/diheme cytochrome c family protein